MVIGECVTCHCEVSNDGIVYCGCGKMYYACCDEHSVCPSCGKRNKLTKCSILKNVIR
jgi:hypothetical protein